MFRLFASLVVVVCLVGIRPAVTYAQTAPAVVEAVPQTTSRFLGLNWPLKPKQKLTALGLSFVVTGLGQLYLGEDEKALSMFAPTLFFPVAWGIDLFSETAQMRSLTLILLSGLKVWSLLDLVNRPDNNGTYL
jgi:hypothetical protein